MGEKLRGDAEATSPNLLRQALRRKGIRAIKISRKSAPLLQKKIKTRDIAVASRQMATMLSAGIPIAQSLETITKTTQHSRLQAIFQELQTDVEAGTSLSIALSKHFKIFNSLYVSMVQVGETSGTLDQLMEKIADHMEEVEAIRNKVSSAMWYPATIIAVGIIVSALILVYVIPQFEDLFSGFGANLPTLTLIMIELSRMVRSLGVESVLITIFSLALLTFTYRRFPKLRYIFEHFILRIPILGEILQKSIVARFCRTLATLFGAGVPLVEALLTVADAMGNRVYFDACVRIRKDVSAGKPMSTAMTMTGLFPPMMLQLITTGEESGEIENMLNKSADFYEREVHESVNNMSKLVEPLMMAILGAIIGTLIIAMYLPIFQMSSII